TYSVRNVGSKSRTELPAKTGNGYTGVAGKARAGSVGSRKSTDPGAPKSAAWLVGSTATESDRPWLLPHAPEKAPAPGRMVEIANPPRITACPLPSNHERGPLAFGSVHAKPAEGAKFLLVDR